MCRIVCRDMIGKGVISIFKRLVYALHEVCVVLGRTDV
jgi:hypothetical protein